MYHNIHNTFIFKNQLILKLSWPTRTSYAIFKSLADWQKNLLDLPACSAVFSSLRDLGFSSVPKSILQIFCTKFKLSIFFTFFVKKHP